VSSLRGTNEAQVPITLSLLTYSLSNILILALYIALSFNWIYHPIQPFQISLKKMASTLGQRFTIVFLIVLNAILAYKANSLLVHDETTMLKIHEQWMARHGRVYESKLEKETRFKIFKDNVELVKNFNKAGNRTYKLAINRFADLTNQEFLASHTGNLMPSNKISSSTTYNSLANDTDGTTTVPSSKDWRREEAVTPVKDQGQCGN